MDPACPECSLTSRLTLCQKIFYFQFFFHMFLLTALVPAISAIFSYQFHLSSFPSFFSVDQILVHFFFHQLCLSQCSCQCSIWEYHRLLRVSRIFFTTLIAIFPEYCCFMTFNENILLWNLWNERSVFCILKWANLYNHRLIWLWYIACRRFFINAYQLCV